VLYIISIQFAFPVLATNVSTGFTMCSGGHVYQIIQSIIMAVSIAVMDMVATWPWPSKG
jgi:hypothetical protein